MTAQPYQLDLQYRGRAISVIAAPATEGPGWAWAAAISDDETLAHKGRTFASPELAIADGKASVEKYVDACDD